MSTGRTQRSEESAYFTEIETCPGGRPGIDLYSTDEIDSSGIHYWLAHIVGGGSAFVYFYQSGTVPDCTDGSAATSSASISGVGGKKFWIAYENIGGSGPFHNPLIYDAAGFHFTYPTIVNIFNVDGHSIKLAYYDLSFDTWDGAFFFDNHSPGGGRIYLSVITNDDLSYIDSQEKLYALIRSFSPSLTIPEKAAELAKAAVGAPYLGDGFTWGGKGWEYVERRYVEPTEIKTGYRFWNNKIKKQDSGAGLDCSGLILWSYNKAAGVNDYVPNELSCSTPICYENADSQFKYNTQVVNGSIQRGDLLFFNFSEAGYNPQCLVPKNAMKCATHVAMFVGGNDVVQAPAPGGKIMISDFNDLKQRVIPQGIRRIIPNPDIGLLAKAGSPISLTVTDPDGFTISQETFIQTDEEYSREIPSNLYYVDAELGPDGKPSARVYAPNLKTGDYLIKPVPLPDTIPSDTYSLEVEVGGMTIVLAKNISISSIPSQGYGIRSTGTVISQFIPIAVDIKPGASDNPINPKSNGKIPVAILSSTTFNAPRLVDVTSLSFGRTGNEKSLAFCNTGGEDVNGDRLLDLVCHFDNKTAAFQSGDTQGILKGKTAAGVSITGKDSIRIVP